MAKFKHAGFILARPSAPSVSPAGTCLHSPPWSTTSAPRAGKAQAMGIKAPLGTELLW